MGTGSSSKPDDEEDDVRNRLNSGDFQKISPPSSPSIEAKKDEMSYSGILVEKPEVEVPTSPVAAATSATPMSASFAADLRTPPISNRSKIKTKPAASAKEQPRRIVKATPPSSKVVVSLDDNRNDNESEDLGEHHPPALASPIGANAANEMLEESIEKNDSKNKRMERVTNKQKSDREKLLQEKRRQQPRTDSKPKVEANPFSRFLTAFSVNTNPTHKRKENIDAGGDPNKRLKYGFTDVSSTAKTESDGTNETSQTDDDENAVPMPFSWIAAASVATVAVLVLAIVRGSKKK